MSLVRRFDHVGINVADLGAATAFFVALGLEVEGTGSVEGEFVETVCGIPGAHCEIAMLRPPDRGSRLELASFIPPDPARKPTAMPNELGLRNVSFEVDDLQTVLDRLAEDGYGLGGGVGQYENSGAWPTCADRTGSSCPWPSGSVDHGRPATDRAAEVPRAVRPPGRPSPVSPIASRRFPMKLSQTWEGLTLTCRCTCSKPPRSTSPTTSTARCPS